MSPACSRAGANRGDSSSLKLAGEGDQERHHSHIHSLLLNTGDIRINCGSAPVAMGNQVSLYKKDVHFLKRFS